MAAVSRNKTVDMLRGMAMLMVVMGHTMTGCAVGSEETLIYNVIWSIQMPMFFLISGYVTQYSRIPSDGMQLCKALGKRTRAYLLPWAVWTLLIRGVIFGEHSYLNIRQLLWNMDSGYWFLFSLWTIGIVWQLSQYAAFRITQKQPHREILMGICYALGAGVLLGIGMVAGLSFLCIKLTLYYMLFFAAGVLYGMVGEQVNRWKKAAFCVCLGIYAWIILRYNLYTIQDNLTGIAIRGIASGCGCICLGFLFDRLRTDTVPAKLLQWVGSHSMGIYLSHYLLLCLMLPSPLPQANSLPGAGSMALNFAITIALSSATAKLLDTNRYVRRICLGK